VIPLLTILKEPFRDENDLKEASLKLAQLIEERENGGQFCVECGALEPLVELLYTYNPELHISASKALCNIAKDMNIVDQLEDLGGLIRLDYLNSSPNPEVAGAVKDTLEYIRNFIKVVKLGYDPQTKTCKKLISIKQETQDLCGVGHKVWPAAYVLARWIWDNPQLFQGKSVLEVGSGPGLAGIVAAEFASEVISTDFIPTILKMLEINAKDNKCNNFQAKYLNWEEVVNGTNTDPLPICDVIIASDVIYGIPLARTLAGAIAKLVGPNTVFYITAMINREGVDEFPFFLRELGLKVTQQQPADEYFSDLATKNMWTLMTCHL